MLIAIKIIIIDLLFTSFRRRRKHQQLRLGRDTKRSHSNKMVSAGRLRLSCSVVNFNGSRSMFVEAAFVLNNIIFYPSHTRRVVTNTLSQDRNATRTAVCAYAFRFRFPFRTVFTARTDAGVVHRSAVPRRSSSGVTAVRRRGCGGGWRYTRVTGSAVITSTSHDYQNRIVVVVSIIITIIIIYMTVAKTRNRYRPPPPLAICRSSRFIYSRVRVGTPCAQRCNRFSTATATASRRLEATNLFHFNNIISSGPGLEMFSISYTIIIIYYTLRVVFRRTRWDIYKKR